MGRPSTKADRGHDRTMEWDDARYVLAIHRAGSLSLAGRALGVNQSTVGRRLEALEAALGVRLFFRTREGYLFTPEGERLLPHAERMEEETQAILREISGQEARLSGVVRVTAPDAMGARLVTPILGRFHARYPGIQLELVADNRSLSLTKREADVAIRVDRPSDPQLVGRRICDLANAPYASKAYVAARGSPRAAGFEGHDLLAYQDPLAYTARARWIADRAAKGRCVFRSSSTPALIAASVAGMGIVLLACYLGDAEPELVRVGTKDDVMMRSIWLVLHRDLQRATRVRACADFLVEGLLEHAAIFAGKREKAPRRAE
jgi:DNA-binding transcriptional LysR family regulator